MKFSRARLRAHRTGNGLSRLGLAKLIDESPSIVAAVEVGDREPSPQLVWKLAHALGQPASELHCIGATYMEDYADVTARYAGTLSDAAVRRAAGALGGVT